MGPFATIVSNVTVALVILLCVIGTALFFDFTNGFHDTGNAVASSIATGALQCGHRVRTRRWAMTPSTVALSR